MRLEDRTVEVEGIDGLIAAASAGDGGSMLVEGPAGIGKTALVEAARERARSAGLRVFAGRGGELEASLSYGVVRQLFERAWLAGGRSRDETAVLGEGVLAGAPAPSVAREDASFGILHALYWFAAELATDAPVLIVVDDAHWADAMSLRFAHYLQRRLEGVPLSLLLAARVGDPVPDLRLLDLLRAEPSVRLVTLRALGREAVAAVADRMYGAPVGRGFAAACHRVTAGNPYYLRELLRALVVDGVAPTEDEAARVEQVTPRALEGLFLGCASLRSAATRPGLPR